MGVRPRRLCEAPLERALRERRAFDHLLYGVCHGSVGRALALAKPFLVTPPVPDYPSTHTVLGWAAAQVLIVLLGDEVRYSVTILTLPGITRHFTGFSAAAHENGQPRVYAGIHFPHAVSEGERQGRSIGRTVAQVLEPVR